MKRVPLKKRKNRETEDSHKSVEDALEMIESAMSDTWDTFPGYFRSHENSEDAGVNKEEAEEEKSEDGEEKSAPSTYYHGSYWIPPSKEGALNLRMSGCVGKLTIRHCVFYFVWKHVWWCANMDQRVDDDVREIKELPFGELLRRVISNVNAYGDCIKHNDVLRSHRQITTIIQDMHLRCKAIWFRPVNLPFQGGESSPYRDVLHDRLCVVFDEKWGVMLHELLNLNKPVTAQMATILGDTFIREVKKIHNETLHIMLNNETAQLFQDNTKKQKKK